MNRIVRLAPWLTGGIVTFWLVGLLCDWWALYPSSCTHWMEAVGIS